MNVEKHKQCFKCGESKPLSAFYKHPRMADGHVNKCTECNKKDVRENRALKLGYYREYDRIRGQDLTTERYKKKLEHGRTEESRIKKRGGRANKIGYESICPIVKKSANTAAGNAIRDGKLLRPTNCEHCGKECKPQAHHSSYAEDMQLLVTWLCTKCHGEVHRDYE